MSRYTRLLLDALGGAGLLYLAVCLYEAGNYLALSLLGLHPSVSLGGLLPIGVSALVPDPSVLVLAKPVQIAISAGSMLALYLLVRRRELPITKAVALCMASVYLASTYWEALSLLGTLSYGLHVAVFSALAMGAQLGLSRVLEVERP